MIRQVSRMAVLVAMLAPFAGCSGDDDDTTGSGGSAATGGSGATGGSQATGGAEQATGGGTSTGGAEQTTGGSTSSGGSGTGGSDVDMSTPAMVACQAFCTAEDACNPDTTIADCIGYTCTKDVAESTAECQAAMKAYWDCRATAQDVCDSTPCADQGAAAGTACSG